MISTYLRKYTQQSARTSNENSYLFNFVIITIEDLLLLTLMISLELHPNGHILSLLELFFPFGVIIINCIDFIPDREYNYEGERVIRCEVTE